jgi:hypothetical protein
MLSKGGRQVRTPMAVSSIRAAVVAANVTVARALCLAYRRLKSSWKALASGLSKARTTIRWLGVGLSLVAVLFAALSYFGFWGHLRGDDLLDALADRLDTSYATNVARQVRQGDPEWSPLVRVIESYSKARKTLPADRKPVVFARLQAVTSAQTEWGEWTAPTTPIALLYRQWPAPGTGPLKPGEDAFLIGTLGDLHEWIRRDRNDFDLLWQRLIFGGLSACVGAFLALAN